MDSLKINLKNEPFQKTTLAKMLDKKDFWGKMRFSYSHYVVLNICEKSGKITKLCFHCLVKAPNILFSNIMMGIFEKILRQGSLSKAEISLINEDIQEANELANKKILTAVFKGISTVVLASAIVVGVANRAVDRQAIRDNL